MGIDPGTKRTGVAIGVAGVAHPLRVLTETGQELVRRISVLAREEEVAVIVVGNPLRLDGSPGPAADAARALADALAEATGLPVTLWDERLTTSEAERSLVGAGVRRNRRRDVVDKVAASVMLQSYLDAGSPAR
jgi:putative Holliday junction resolvase